MKCTSQGVALAALASLTTATSLNDVCNTDFVKSVLPSDAITGVVFNPDSVTAEANTNVSVSDSSNFPDAVINFCNVTVSYSHSGLNDTVLLNYWFPEPEKFRNRFLATGGFGSQINAGTDTSGSLPGGVMYGAVSGLTDGGFGGFSSNIFEKILVQNGTMDRDTLYMFGYQAIHEMTVLGKAFTQNFYSTSNGTKLYSYYQGCSEGGREGMSQIQRFPDQFDGAAIGAPALRYAFQQVLHLWPAVAQKMADYVPSSCEYGYIVNATVSACDPLDGKTDGVVARSDLCLLEFDLDSVVGQAYSCAAGYTGSQSMMAASSSDIPAQNGTVTQEAVDLIKTILEGPKDTDGRQIYLSWQPGASIDDAATTYNSDTGEWEIEITPLGGEYIAQFLQLLELDNLSSIDNVTTDTLKDWMYQGWAEYEDVLQTTWPDLSSLRDAGAKIIHVHGEQDGSIPTASSVRYYESVRKILYGDLNSTKASYDALGEWYKFYPVPGAGHCGPNTAQPNGPWPQTNLQVLIDWVESGNAPSTLNGTVLQGEHKGENQQICAWPLRPMWTNDSASPECVYNETSLGTWTYDFNAFKMPVY